VSTLGLPCPAPRPFFYQAPAALRQQSVHAMKRGREPSALELPGGCRAPPSPTGSQPSADACAVSSFFPNIDAACAGAVFIDLPA
jgi:hypothetical protein